MLHFGELFIAISSAKHLLYLLGLGDKFCKSSKLKASGFDRNQRSSKLETWTSNHLTTEDQQVKLATAVEGDPKAPFSIATTQKCSGGCYSIPWMAHFTLDPYLIMLSIKQGGIKYHFLNLRYYSIWELTPVSRTIGEHSTHLSIYRRNDTSLQSISKSKE